MSGLLAVLIAIQGVGAVPFEEFDARGYGHTVCGAWFTAETPAASGFPLGGLGTGYVDLQSDGRFGHAVMENNWLKPQPVPDGCGWTIKAGDKEIALFGGKGKGGSLRFWGHYPMADLDFGADLPVRVYGRAFSPVVPHDYALSNVPAALFRFYIDNTGGDCVPIEIALQWRQEIEGDEVGGNVEGALGWRLGSLPPGRSWRVVPTLVYSPARNQLPQRLAEARVPLTILEPAAGENGSGVPQYRAGAVTEFCLDRAGGFNWEERRVQSAVYGGKRTIGQMFWHLCSGDIEAGRGMNGSYGLKGDSLPAKTAGGELAIAVQAYKAGTDAVALVYTFTNVSGRELTDLRFGFSVNADLGGPEASENQRVTVEREFKALVFSDPRDRMVMALSGDASDYVAGTWPGVHDRMRQTDWTSFDAPKPQLLVQSFPDGIQIGNNRGSYAIGAEGEGWTIKALRAGDNEIQATAARKFAAGEMGVVSFGLAWHFPYWVSSDGERLRHRYDLNSKNAGEALQSVILRAAEIEQAIIAWQSRVYGAPAPPLLKDALINSLYIWPRNSWWPADGRFFQSESFTGCPITETFVCRFNGSFPLAVLFPECEQATMRSVADAQAESGEIPFGFGSPAGSRSPYFHVQHPIVSSEFVLLTWRNYELWRDGNPDAAARYLENMYPHVQRAMRFAATLDKDGDGLVNEDPGSEKGFPANQYYDIWPWWGTSAYTAGIWLAALKAAQSVAEARRDAAFGQEMAEMYGRGSAAFDQLLWTGGYYRLYNWPAKKRVSETSLTNALCGQWFAYATGLGDVVPKEHVHSVIDTVLRLNVPATSYGAVNGVKPDGKPDESFPDHSAVITIGEVWNFCAMAAFAGRTEDAVALFDRSYGNVLVNQRTPWNIPWSLDRKTGAIKWGINYYSNPCVWTLLRALAAPVYRDLAAPDS